MSHPDIRRTIDSLFALEKLKPVYLAPHEVPASMLEAVSHHGDFAMVTLLSFLEQEVCRQARVFAGMHVSSMSRMVALLRLSGGGVDEAGERTLLLGKNFNKDGKGGQLEGRHAVE